MEEEQDLKQHVCKFCRKSFYCGRSLGGHMRSHMVNDNSALADGTKLTKKKLPSFTNYNTNSTATTSTEIANSGRRGSPEKSCKVCGKVFQSWKAMCGHMKRHSILEDQENVSDDNVSLQEEQCMDSEPDSKSAAPNRRKRSKRRMLYVGGTEIDQQEQEEVALCLMMLSRDVGHWGLNYAAESSDINSEFSVSGISGKVFANSDKRKLGESWDPEPKSDCVRNPDKSIRFECTTCNKVFNSYQALGGHRASHKKTKTCTASGTYSRENSIEIKTEPSPDRTEDSKHIIRNEVSIDSDKQTHECPICFKVFTSRQAFGVHKRSHLLTEIVKDQAKNQESNQPKIGDFLDLNLPAPEEEESYVVGFHQWWITSRQSHEQLVGFFSN